MNELTMLDENLSVERTPELIAIEINSIKEQTRKILLLHSIEIGRKLAEAKLIIKHGEWGKWLSKSVDYSQRTASYLMAIFEQYGSSQMVMFCDNAKSQALANLSYTQAVALLGIPQDERESFIQEHDIDSMSTRELQQAIKEKQELETKLMELEVAWGKDKSIADNAKHIADNAKHIAEEKAEEARKLLEEKQGVESNLRVTDKVLRETQADVKRLQDRLAEEKEESKKEIIRLGQSIADMNKSLEVAQASGNADEVEHLNKLLVETDGGLHTAYKKIEDLESQLKEPIEVTAAEVIEKIPEEIERELAELRERNKELEAKGAQPVSTATIRFKLQFDSLVKGFGDLLRVLSEIDAEENEKYKNVIKGLIGKMSEKL